MANANVALPPSITASKTYRCKDNSIVYIDWLSDRKLADVNEVGEPKPGRRCRPAIPTLTGRRRAVRPSAYNGPELQSLSLTPA